MLNTDGFVRFQTAVPRQCRYGSYDTLRVFGRGLQRGRSEAGGQAPPGSTGSVENGEGRSGESSSNEAAGPAGTGSVSQESSGDRAGTVREGLDVEECAKFSQTADNTIQPADIIWAVDNGGNMQEDIQFVRDNLNRFSQQIVDSGIDVHLVMISDALDPDVVSQATPLGGPSGDWRSICIDPPLGSGNCPDDTNLPNYLHIDQEVGRGHDIIPTPERHPVVYQFPIDEKR